MADEEAAAAAAAPPADAPTEEQPFAAPPSADTLLALDPAAASARWAALDDDALDAEVAAYRTALEGLRSELAALGRTVELEDGQAGTIAGVEVRGGCGRAEITTNGGPMREHFFKRGPNPSVSSYHPFLKQGVEGVDYHLGSVDDLDPSEWQVRALKEEGVCCWPVASLRSPFFSPSIHPSSRTLSTLGPAPLHPRPRQRDHV